MQTLRHPPHPVRALGVLLWAGVFLSGVVVVAAHHDCHAAAGEPCAICFHAAAPTHLPPAAVVPPSPFVFHQNVVPLTEVLPSSRAVVAASARDPPSTSV